MPEQTMIEFQRLAKYLLERAPGQSDAIYYQALQLVVTSSEMSSILKSATAGGRSSPDAIPDLTRKLLFEALADAERQLCMIATLLGFQLQDVCLAALDRIQSRLQQTD